MTDQTTQGAAGGAGGATGDGQGAPAPFFSGFQSPDAKAWAEGLGASLPTRFESALLYANVRDLLDTNLIRAGEASGQLPDVLASLAEARSAIACDRLAARVFEHNNVFRHRCAREPRRDPPPRPDLHGHRVRAPARAPHPGRRAQDRVGADVLHDRHRRQCPG